MIHKKGAKPVHVKLRKTRGGCLVCGKPLVYRTDAALMRCELCGREHISSAACEAGHFVCDECHVLGGAELAHWLVKQDERDPIRLFLRAVSLPGVHLHGPEHHMIVPCVLLTAYRNNGGDIDLPKSIVEASRRAGSVPGGACGYWGACGAAVGAGIYLSIVTGSHPKNAGAWSLPMLLTSRCLERIAAAGGPRCCKRTSRISITVAAELTRKRLGVDIPVSTPVCTYHAENKECIRGECPYYYSGTKQ